MKLGYIDYLNCYPFYYHMMEKEPLPEVEIVAGYPSDLNRMMKAGQLDMSPISSASYPAMADEISLLPDFCLSSVGYVHSVILVSTRPIQELNGLRVGLSTASQTSVVLLKIILQHYYGIVPRYSPSCPKPSLRAEGLDAALIIGNEAMLTYDEPFEFRYDLGDLWLKKTGYPVVFAVFAIRIGSMDRCNAQIEAVKRSYARSLACLDREREVLLSKAREKYSSLNCDVDIYYQYLQYTMGPELTEGLTFYLNLAGELGLVPKVTKVWFI
jgi:chorismate dehydratase